MRDFALPGLLGLSWLLFVSAVLHSRRGRPRYRQGVAALIVAAGVALLALWGETLLAVGLLSLGVAGVVMVQRRRRRAAPALEEMALLADYLAHRLLGGSNLAQALRQAGQDAARTPPTLPLPLLGPGLAQQAQMMATGRPEAQALLELGEQFDDATARSFFVFLSSISQHVTQAGMAGALEGMAERVRAYQELDQSFQSRLSLARATRYVMSLLVPGLLYMMAYHSPLLGGGLFNSPVGALLTGFDLLMLGLAMLAGSLMSRLPSLEF